MILLFIFANAIFFSQTPLSARLLTNELSWTQWGMNPQHTGMIEVAGQDPQVIKGRIRVDPFRRNLIEDHGGFSTYYFAGGQGFRFYTQNAGDLFVLGQQATVVFVQADYFVRTIRPRSGSDGRKSTIVKGTLRAFKGSGPSLIWK
jgi:hypothetical protein